MRQAASHHIAHKRHVATKKQNTGNEKYKNDARAVTSMVTINSTNVLLAMALINIKTIHNNDIILRAVIDQGSQSSFITENAAQMIGLPRTKIQAIISGIGAQEKHSKFSVKLTIRPRMLSLSPYEFQTDAIIMPKIMKYTPLKSSSKWEYIDQLTLADPNYDEESDIDVLLGAADFAQIIKRGLIKGAADEPIAQNTELGWIVTGKMDGNRCRSLV